jgi:hypothetical protein
MFLGVREEVVDHLEERAEADAAGVAERAGGRPGGGEERRPGFGGDDSDAVECGVAEVASEDV